MPTVLRWRGYQFLFYSLDEGEPPHIHVRRNQAKFWLSDCQLAKARGFADHELRQIRRKIEEQREELLRAWHEHFGA
jgi:hypothetical protein